MTLLKALLSAVILATCTAALAADAPKKDDAKKLQGMWRVTKFIDHSEEAAPAHEIAHFTFEFKGDILTIRKHKNDAGREMKYTLDASKKPKAIDIEIDDRASSEGIYKLDGEELMICVVAGSRGDKTAARPTEFKASKRDVYSLFVLKKVKK